MAAKKKDFDGAHKWERALTISSATVRHDTDMACIWSSSSQHASI